MTNRLRFERPPAQKGARARRAEVCKGEVVTGSALLEYKKGTLGCLFRFRSHRFTATGFRKAGRHYISQAYL